MKKFGFCHATRSPPSYRWEDIYQFSDKDIARFQNVIESTAHLIIEFSKEARFENASGF